MGNPGGSNMVDAYYKALDIPGQPRIIVTWYSPDGFMTDDYEIDD